MCAAKNKTRLDQALLDRGLVGSRSQAKSLILAGKVLVNDNRIDKAGFATSCDDVIRLKETQKYVSRGGFKLEHALETFKIDVTDKTCVDVGSSTGGFTDCLLQNGAKKVYAIDVGYGQMHWKLQQDPRVTRIDRENFRHFDIHRIPEAIDTAVMDVSFISIKLLIPKVVELLQSQPACTQQEVIFLIKPQFEVGKEHVGKGGIVRDESIKDQTVKEIVRFAEDQGFKDLQTTPSPITGADGNHEYLLWAKLDHT